MLLNSLLFKVFFVIDILEKIKSLLNWTMDNYLDSITERFPNTTDVHIEKFMSMIINYNCIGIFSFWRKIQIEKFFWNIQTTRIGPVYACMGRCGWCVFMLLFRFNNYDNHLDWRWFTFKRYFPNNIQRKWSVCNLNSACYSLCWMFALLIFFTYALWHC